MSRRVDILAADGRIEAVIRGASAARTPGGAWSGPFASLKALGSVGRLLSADAVFDAELTARWGRLVACTPEFSAWWRARPDAGAPQPSFFLEVGHG